MRGITSFLKTTAMGGLFVLLPVLLLYLLISEAMEAVIMLATPIADLFPKGTFDQEVYPALISAILIVIASFLIGLTLRFGAGRRFGAWIERKVLGRLPAYHAIKGLTTGFAKAKDGGAFRPAVLTSPEGVREFAYVIENHDDGQMTVLLPWVPTPFAGSLKIVSQERIEVLDTNLGDFTKVLSEWGVGARDLIGKGAK